MNILNIFIVISALLVGVHAPTYLSTLNAR